MVDLPLRERCVCRGPQVVCRQPCSSASQDEVEAEFERIAELVPGLEHVLDGQADQMRIGVGVEVSGDVACHCDELALRLGRESSLLQCEAVDERIEYGIGMCGHLPAQPSPAHAGEHRLVVAEVLGAG